MITFREPAFAKINLTLDVLCKREDGYHDLSTVMQSVSLHDDIEIDLDTGRPWEILCAKADVPCDEHNLAWKAARTFFDELGEEPNGLTVRITKRIPSRAGLGGGSSDAAAVLRVLNRWKKEPFSAAALCDLGAKVGSDVPFCIPGGTALAESRGEKLTGLPNIPDLHFVICKPELAFSTPRLYARLDEINITERPDTPAMLTAIKTGDVRLIGENLCNVFEQAVIPNYPEIQDIKSAMMACGACGALMTGSGSAVYGVFVSSQKAMVACAALGNRYSEVHLARTV